MAPEPEDSDENPVDEERPGPLVPLPVGGREIVHGIQAFRRGDAILYSVRGEPELVRELMGRLGQDGVEEVVAFISHQIEPGPAPREPDAEDEGQDD